jgi:hypothetical protein
MIRHDPIGALSILLIHCDRAIAYRCDFEDSVWYDSCTVCRIYGNGVTAQADAGMSREVRLQLVRSKYEEDARRCAV